MSSRKYDDAELRILDAAHRVFMRRGTAGARTQEIADEAGVNKSMLHYYFRTKERLADAVFERAASRWLRELTEAMDDDAPIDAIVRAVIRGETQAIEERPYLSGYLMSEVHHRPDQVRVALRSMPEIRLEKLRDRLRAASSSGEILPISAEDFVVHLVSLVVFPHAARDLFQASLRMDDPKWEAAMDRRIERLTAFFLRGLGFQETGDPT
ncbi:MAG: helix-turn-helix domain-containing protein [Bacteroidota bacterium]